jgi:uncharacterized membrane protein
MKLRILAVLLAALALMTVTAAVPMPQWQKLLLIGVQAFCVATLVVLLWLQP